MFENDRTLNRADTWRTAVLLAACSILPACGSDGGDGPAAGPGNFSPLSPAAGMIEVPLNPTFQWDASAGAASYTLEVATDVAFSAMVIQQSGIVATSFALSGNLVGATTYYWRVTATGAGGGTTSTGAPWSFTTLTP